MFEVLWRETDIADVLVATQTPNLWLLPPGRAPLSVRPALARNELLADMLHQLDQHFDHLVFDLPAVLVTSDAIALASLCDGFVLVVRQGMASRPQIRGAVESMRGVPSLGIVLNKVPLRGADATAYSYEYRRDYTSTKKGEEAPAPEPADIEIPAPLDDELVSEPPTPARRGRRS